MRNLLAVGIVTVAGLMAAPALAADYPEYYPPEIPPLPPVDYGLSGGFYLRGSVAGNIWSAHDGQYCNCVASFNDPGYGYSLGVGVGYETGTGVRADVTLDYIDNSNLTSTAGEKVKLRSGLALANIYYDFNLSDGGSAAGGFGAYVGAGVGAAYNYSKVDDGTSNPPWGTSVEAAGALMAGVTYDMGTAVADLGWRGIYMNKVMNQPEDPSNAYIINHNFINELRATVRYRFN